MRKHKISQRFACRVVEQHRSSQRYDPVPPDFEVRLVKAMRQLANEHPRWGYRRVHALLKSQGWEVNVKRVERLWVEPGELVVRGASHICQGILRLSGPYEPGHGA